jgi:hypothetical protein
MNFEPGKFYRTRDGRKALIYAVYPDENEIHGAIKNKLFNEDKWNICNWSLDGHRLIGERGIADLVSPWVDMPEVDWDALPPHIVAVAKCRDGRKMGFVSIPVFQEEKGVWRYPKDDCGYLPYIRLKSEHYKFSGNLEDSLIVRPCGKGK